MLSERLNTNRIAYVLFHLSQHFECDSDLRLCFFDSDNPTSRSFYYLAIDGKLVELPVMSSDPCIYFPLTANKADYVTRVEHKGRNIPVLFPLHEDICIYEFDENSNLIFRHDLLKAAFLILSGYQETLGDETDVHGRYRYEDSLQKQLNITTIPVVNYYFDLIVEGLSGFCQKHGIGFRRKRLFENFGFLLSHDVDRIAFYHPREVAFKLKQLLGMAPLYYSKADTLKLFFKGILYNINPLHGEDPWWNFGMMTELEKKLGLRSSFYFLEKNNGHFDSRYTFRTARIRRLINRLNEEGFETGLHGSYNSAFSKEALCEELNSFTNNTGIKPVGIRQHFLRLRYPDTLLYQEELGFEYDTSLAFAEHEGFRNGYCYPFRPYDFNKDRMAMIWEFPLMLMEVSILGEGYRNLPYTEIGNCAMTLIDEVRKFGGFFSMLWHNCRLDESLYPGITNYYRTLLEDIIKLQPEALTGKDLLNIIKEE